jgi:molybdate transport system permease protein
MFEAVWVTLKLATVTVVLLLLLGTPLAWWLSITRSRFKAPLEAITAVPLVLPPTVLGFYLLILMGEHGWLGQVWQTLFAHPLSFTFTGLVLASCLYSLPFVVQPLQAAFEQLDRNAIEAAWTLGASRRRTFYTIVIPQARRGFVTAIVLGFAHTLGEFGVVLMVGGSIPGETKVMSIAIYEYVETLQYQQAHWLSLALLGFSFLVLWLVYALNRHKQVGRWT